MLHQLRDFAETIEMKEAKKLAREKLRFARNEQTRNVAMKRIREGVRHLERILGSSTEIFEHQRRVARRRTPADRMCGRLGWHLGLQMSELAGVFGLDEIGTGPTTLRLRGASTRGIAGDV